MTPDDGSRPPLDRAGLRLPPADPPWQVEVAEQSPSTNADLAARAREGAPAGLVLVAEHQSAGRGRLGRGWLTPPRAALTFSLLVAPDVPAARWPWLPLLTGLAVADAVSDAGVPTTLKWPNDVLVGGGPAAGRKLAGILVERVERPGGAAAVVGIGLNVSTTADELPVASATSMLLAGGAMLDRTLLLGRLLAGFTRWYDRWRAGDLTGGQTRGQAGGLRTAYAARCSTIGRRVRVELPAGTSLTGTCVGVDEVGRVLVEDAAGRHAVGAGDVVHVRGADAPGVT